MADQQNYNSAYTGPQIDQSVGAVLGKETDWDAAFAGKMPAGGEAGQVLEKTGPEDNAATWRTPATFSRQDLLTNSYFVGGGSQQGEGIFPINQRGQTNYTGGGNYSIDRWKMASGQSGAASVEVLSDCVKIGNTASAGQAWVQQRFPNALPAGTYTLSILVKSVTGTVSIGYLDAGGSFGGRVKSIKSAGVTQYPITLTTDGVKIYRVAIHCAASSSVEVIAAKLEVGDTQTLAHQESGAWVLNDLPDFSEELFKCQRYFQIIPASTDIVAVGYGVGWTTTAIRITIPLAAPLRYAPNGTTVTIQDCNVRLYQEGLTNNSIREYSSVEVLAGYPESAYLRNYVTLVFSVSGAIQGKQSTLTIGGTSSSGGIQLSADL